MRNAKFATRLFSRSTARPQARHGRAGGTAAPIEAMEPRRLLAADGGLIAYDDYDNSVRVMGTDAGDVIQVNRVGTDDVDVTVNAITRRFDLDDVEIIALYAEGGDDSVRALGDYGRTLLYVFGGTGTDTLAANEAFFRDGETYSDGTRTVATGRPGEGLEFRGTAGNDTIAFTRDTEGVSVRVGTSFSGSFPDGEYLAYSAVGDAGADTFSVGHAVSATLIGGSGNDVFNVASGARATVFGNDGNDLLRALNGDFEESEPVSIVGFTGGAGTDTIELSGQGGLDLGRFPDVENVANAAGTVRGNALNNRIAARAGETRALVADGLGGNDTLIGGSGNDTLRGNEGNDSLSGSGGNDVIRGGDGSDRMDGGDGNDLLDGGLGGDEFIGGLGTDLADYSSRTENLTIGIGSYADDGAAGEGDNVRTGVEDITTGSGNDTVSGDGVRNVLRGGAGNDTLRGLGGNDFFNAGTGADRVYGGDGNDEFYMRDGIKDLVLDGGLGTDKAQVDSTDPRTSIEQTIA